MDTLVKDKLLVIWQDNETRLRWIIGYLTKGDNYEFTYNIDNIEKLKSKGFRGLTAFPELNKKYFSKNLFAPFASRLPDKRRSDIDEILKTCQLETYDEFQLLKKSGGRLPTDSLEFVEPIDLSQDTIRRQFYIAGVKFSCVDCSTIAKIPLNAKMELMPEPTNNVDKNAVVVMYNGTKIGYIPTYFGKEVTKALENRNVTLNVLMVNAHTEFDKNCHECITVQLTIE